MEKKRLIQALVIIGLVALNVGTFGVLSGNFKDGQNAQLKRAWINEDIQPVAARSANIYSIESLQASMQLDSMELSVACDQVFDETTEFKAEFINTSMPKKYGEHEFIRIQAALKNVGETSWYGAEHPCSAEYKLMQLGNMDKPEEMHLLWNDFNFVDNDWSNSEFKNRVELSEKEVKPGEEGNFSFWIETPITKITTDVDIIKNEETGEEEKDVKMYKWAYEKYTFTPIIAGKWLSEVKIPLTLKVGDLPPKEADKLRFIDEKLDNFNLKDFNGEKNVYIRLSDQTGFLRYGDKAFHSYKVSSGSWDKKTPTGDHKVANKQELRVGGKSPYYRMPYWLGLSINGAPFIGYGLHEVPYLGASRETSQFYKNGLKYDLGKNVSHGCVRSGDKDAPFLFEFGEIGMSVYVRNKDDEKMFATIDPPKAS
ncbi:MAG: L,D-transpeptidase [Candidatus Peregrinibacteria bacterium]|nr:L,D-transpeptidase [Candidatus Peregrinibacteria bacterium]MDZ4245151.1 L,D-transpeptidase [Candidatus Gracilibacteria bacterium]